MFLGRNVFFNIHLVSYVCFSSLFLVFFSLCIPKNLMVSLQFAFGASDLKHQDAGSQAGLAESDHGPKSLVPAYGSLAEC